MDVPGGNMLQKEQQARKENVERVRALRQARQEARAQEYREQQQQLQDFFARQEASSYQDKDTRKENVIREELGTIIQNQKDVQENVRIENFDRTSAKYMSIKDHTAFLDNQTKLTAKDKKWYNFLKGDSQEMTYVKQSVNFLNNLLDSEKDVLANGLKDQIKDAYRKVLMACEGYIYSHPEPKHSTGMRRLAQVNQIYRMMKEEQVYLAIALDNVLVGQVQKGATVRETIASLREKKAKVSIYSKEGNSSDVYRVTLADDDGNLQNVYLKKDEKLLNDDLPGFLDRRIEQLQRSHTNKKAFWEANGINSEEAYTAKLEEIESRIDGYERTLGNKEATEEQKADAAEKITQIRSTQEELRLAAGHLDDTDYEFANRFLQKMKDSIEELPGKEQKEEKIQRYIRFLGHDFDDVFKKLQAYNANVEKLTGDRDMVERRLAVYREAAAKGGTGSAEAKQILDMWEKSKGQEIKVMSEYEWLEEHAAEFGLSKTEDAEILNLLKELSDVGIKEEQYDKNRVSRLFLRSLGKEAELFGQQCDRSGMADTAENLASNNTATARLANFCHMEDIVTRSWKEMVTFQEFGKTEKTTALCTVSEVAEGEEMMSLVQQAEAIQKERGLDKSIIHYSPNAMQQMMKLQLFDTLCLQTDRHWRNFKCRVKRYDSQNPPVWVVESLRSYDHDQSFGPKNLDTFFSDKAAAKGFISPLVTTVKKTDPQYHYYKEKFMLGLEGDSFLSKIKTPEAKGEFAEAMKKFKEEHNNQDLYESEFGALCRMSIFTASAKSSSKYKAMKQAARNANPENPDIAEKVIAEGLSLWDTVKFFDKMPQTRDDKLKSEKEKCATDIMRQVRNLIDMYNQVDLTRLEVFEKELLKQKPELRMDASVETPMVSQVPSELRVEGKLIPGTIDYIIQSALYFARSLISVNKDVRIAYEKEEVDDSLEKIKEEMRTMGKEPTDEDVKQEAKNRGISEEGIEVPTMLHMDKKAYENIKRVDDQWEEVNMLLLDLGWGQEKRQALRERAQQIMAQAQIAKKKAEEYFARKGLTGVKAKFFLDDDDYKEFSDITEIAPDPSMSYFSSEDPSYLLGEKEFSEMITNTEKQKLIDNTNAMRGHVRQRLEKLEKGQYRQLVNGQVITPAMMEELEKAELKAKEESKKA